MTTPLPAGVEPEDDARAQSVVNSYLREKFEEFKVHCKEGVPIACHNLAEYYQVIERDFKSAIGTSTYLVRTLFQWMLSKIVRS